MVLCLIHYWKTGQNSILTPQRRLSFSSEQILFCRFDFEERGSKKGFKQKNEIYGFQTHFRLVTSLVWSKFDQVWKRFLPYRVVHVFDWIFKVQCNYDLYDLFSYTLLSLRYFTTWLEFRRERFWKVKFVSLKLDKSIIYFESRIQSYFSEL